MRWTLALVALWGCYAPHPAPGGPCANGACPEGLACSPATNTCELRAIDAGRTDGPVLDARVDATAADAPVDAPSGPMLVQQKTRSSDAAAMLSVTLGAAPRSGDVLVMVGADPQGSLVSVSGGGATWILAARATANANVEIWFGVTDGSSSTVTISLPNSASPMWMSVSEWSGLAGTLDRARASSGTISPASAGSIATANARDLLLFAVADGAPNTFGTPGPGTWTALTGINGLFTQAEWYRVVSATGTYAPTVSETAGAWDAAIAALRIAP